MLVRAQYGNYTLAGIVSAVNVIAVCVGAPILARWVDRFGQSRIMAPAAAIYGVGICGILVGSLLLVPSWVLLLSAAVAGLAQGSPGALVRARWSAALRNSNQLQTAYALEAAIDEFSFILGPVLATVLGTAIHPAAGMVLMLIALVVGNSWFLSLKNSEPKPVSALFFEQNSDHSDADSHQHAHATGDTSRTWPKQKSLLLNPVIIVLALTYVGAGAMFAANDLGDIAFTTERGHPELAGVVTGAFAFGSFAAALVYGARMWKTALWKLFAIGVVALALGSSTFLLAHSIPVLMAATIISGLAIAPTMTNVNTIVTKVVPPNRLTEGLTRMSTAKNIGVSVGAPTAGAITDLRGSRGAFELVIVFAWLMVALMLIGLPKLRKATIEAAHNDAGNCNHEMGRADNTGNSASETCHSDASDERPAESERGENSTETTNS